MRLDGRTVLITGAATGIGHATALAMAKAGAGVVINHLAHADLANALADEIRQVGGRAWCVQADVSEAASVAQMMDQLARTCPSIDTLVHNAGIIQEKPFLETTVADWDRMLAIDLSSAFLMAKAVLPGMVAKDRGNLIFLASDLAMLGRSRFAPYCAAKAGVIGLTKSLALEFAPHIRVNAIAPGPVATAMLSPDSMSARTLAIELDIPQRRFAEPSEIAATALFLASDFSSFYTGQVLGPNGGSVMP